MNTIHLEYRWTVSRGRDTYGYNICSLYANGSKVASCNGGGYDMQGVCLGNYIARNYAPRLLQKIKKPFYGLTFHDPTFDPGKAIVGEGCTDRTLSGNSKGRTVEEREAAGDSMGLERYQAFYNASSATPTKTHTVPRLDGACSKECMQRVGEAIGLTFQYVPPTGRQSRIATYLMLDHWPLRGKRAG